MLPVCRRVSKFAAAEDTVARHLRC